MGDAFLAHEEAVKNFGGRRGIHDIGRIEAAIARPYSGYCRLIHKKAASLIHGVATNHGFIDGNKRTAYTLFYLLLAQSGYRFQKTSTITDEDDIERLVLDATTRFLDQEEVALWLKKRIRRA